MNRRQRLSSFRLDKRELLATSLMNGLIEHWSLSEQSGDRLGSHYGLTLTNNNSVGGAMGVNSLASQFNNSQSRFLQRASQTELQAGNINFTLSAWVYLDSKTASYTFLSKGGSDTSREYLLQYVVGTDRFRFLVYDGAGTIRGNVSETNFGSPSVGVWYMITAIHDLIAGQVSIRVNNGTPVSSATTGSLGVNTSAFNIGISNTPAFQYWDGRIQRVSFWKRVLSSDEISFLYNGGSGRDYPFN